MTIQNKTDTMLTLEQKQVIAQSILKNALEQGASTLFLTMQNSLRVNFLKHGMNIFLDLEEKYQVHTYQDSLDICSAFCSLFKNSMTTLMSNHGGTLDYNLNNINYHLRYVCNIDYHLRYVCNMSFPHGFSITVLIN